MAKEIAKVRRLEGVVLVKLGRPETETLALANRMLQLGRAIRERFESARDGEVIEAPIACEVPLTMREMVLGLPFSEILKIYCVVSDGVEASYGASYYVPGRAVGGHYLSEELGVINARQLGMKQSEAAESLVYPTHLIDDEKIWQGLLNSVSTATAASEEYPHAPWGVPER